MRPVVERIAGREVELRLTIGALDEVAAVQPLFTLIGAAFGAGVWDWREVRAILGAALRPHGVELQALMDERGLDGCVALAARLWGASMPVASPDDAPADPRAAAPESGGRGGST